MIPRSFGAQGFGCAILEKTSQQNRQTEAENKEKKERILELFPKAYSKDRIGSRARAPSHSRDRKGRGGVEAICHTQRKSWDRAPTCGLIAINLLRCLDSLFKPDIKGKLGAKNERGISANVDSIAIHDSAAIKLALLVMVKRGIDRIDNRVAITPSRLL